MNDVDQAEPLLGARWGPVEAAAGVGALIALACTGVVGYVALQAAGVRHPVLLAGAINAVIAAKIWIDLRRPVWGS